MSSPNTIAETPTINETRAPQMQRSEHVTAVAVAAEEGPVEGTLASRCRRLSSFGSAIGRIGANTAPRTTITNHAIASHAPMPSFRFRGTDSGVATSGVGVLDLGGDCRERFGGAHGSLPQCTRACRIRGSSTV